MHPAQTHLPRIWKTDRGFSLRVLPPLAVPRPAARTRQSSRTRPLADLLQPPPTRHGGKDALALLVWIKLLVPLPVGLSIVYSLADQHSGSGRHRPHTYSSPVRLVTPLGRGTHIHRTHTPIPVLTRLSTRPMLLRAPGPHSPRKRSGYTHRSLLLLALRRVHPRPTCARGDLLDFLEVPSSGLGILF